MTPRAANISIAEVTFNPCSECGAGEMLAKRFPFVVDEFRAAVRRLEQLDHGYDDCGRPIAVTDDEVRDVADHFH